ncbi:SLATT domain-containing protein [Nonomuraea sp. NPDC050783]|uniref:SLATT domain-containing protein n=1 Tax=Nonomuraea sp. NPDC050783 TaxID=3154634 RepID=UPI0034674114
MTGRESEFRELYSRLRIADQRGYYEERSREYGAAHHQVIVLRNLLLFAAALAGLAGQFTTAGGRAACGVVAAFLAALAAAVTAFESLIGFAKLQKLYADAAMGLAAAAIAWDSAPPHADMSAEVERVEQIFRVENGQWGQLMAEEDRPPRSAAPSTMMDE